MDNEQIFEDNTKSNYVKNLNAENEKKRLEHQIKSYRTASKNNNSLNNALNRPIRKTGNKPSGNSLGADSSVSSSANSNQGSTNSVVTNQAASAGLTAAGVPKPAADAIVNSKIGQKIIGNQKKKNPLLNMFNKFNGEEEKETEEEYSGEGFVNFEITPQTIKKALIVIVCGMTVLSFCVLLIAPQVVIKSVGLNSADKVSNEKMEDAINKKDPDDLSEEVTDKDLTGFNYFIEDEKSLKFVQNKFNESNLIMVDSTEEKKCEVDNILCELEDFYPPISALSENYDEDLVYDFFYKLYKLYHHYNGTYKVQLNLPLLMSTLQIQSSDMNLVFNSNLSEEDKSRTNRKNYPEFDYYYDWNAAKYITTPESGIHDMAILAHHMVSVADNSKCTELASDGKCYVIDEERYNEFLKEFIEKKYYLDEEVPLSGVAVNSSSSSKNYCTIKEFTKYDLTDDQLAKIASVAYHEQGTPKGAAAEASLMANRFEIYGSKFGTGADGLYNYVRNSGWFAHAGRNMDSYDASAEVITAVKSVLVDGLRTLPGYVDEHDCIVCYNDGSGDIISATNDGQAISVTDKASYIQHKTKLVNKYMSSREYYVFYSFPTENSDPFGYTSEDLRKKIGDFYYDYDTKNPVDCEIEGKDGNYVDGLSFADSNFGKIYYYNQNDYKKYYYSKDPENYKQFTNATIASHGCGPTSLAIVASSIFNKEITPIETTKKVCESGGCTSSGSTYGSLVKVGQSYNINVITTSNNQEVLNALATNKSLVIVLMGPGTFTSGGHFIVLTGVNSSGQVSVADPYSRNLTEKKWFSFNTIIEQRKKYSPYMIFSR